MSTTVPWLPFMRPCSTAALCIKSAGAPVATSWQCAEPIVFHGQPRFLRRACVNRVECDDWVLCLFRVCTQAFAVVILAIRFLV